jgi:nucleoside-diphosphate-sugar epimerase
MRALVTGGGGFIGSHVAEHLCAGGHDVRILDNFSTGNRTNLAAFRHQVELIEGDIRSYERVNTAVKGCEVVFHQAALPSVPRSVQDPLTSNAANVIGTLNVLLASRDSGVRRVVFASSSSVYGASETLPKREDLPATPISPYAVAKLAGEGYCRSFAGIYGLETVSLRYFNVFGPRQDPLSQYSAVIPNFITACRKGEPLTIFGDGEQSRDFSYIANVVDANLLASEAEGVAGKVFNIATGQRISLNALVDELRSLTGREIEVNHEPARQGDVRHSLADLSRSSAALGYEPAIDFREGLRLTFEAYAETREENARAAGGGVR